MYSFLILLFIYFPRKSIPQYGIANIPPVVMFNAKIFKPSRLCAVYKIDGLSEAAKEAHREKVQRAR